MEALSVSFVSLAGHRVSLHAIPLSKTFVLVEHLPFPKNTLCSFALFFLELLVKPLYTFECILMSASLLLSPAAIGVASHANQLVMKRVHLHHEGFALAEVPL